MENIGRTLSDINCCSFFFNPSPRAVEIKTKINKWDPLKLKNLCTVEETINNIKRQHRDSEKILVNDATEKGLVSKINKQLRMLKSTKTNNPVNNGQKT